MIGAAISNTTHPRHRMPNEMPSSSRTAFEAGWRRKSPQFCWKRESSSFIVWLRGSDRRSTLEVAHAMLGLNQNGTFEYRGDLLYHARRGTTTCTAWKTFQKF